MRGRPLKAQPQDGGARRQFEFTELGREPVKDAPTLGRRPGGGRWSAATRDWFEVWRRSPQASQFVETDWSALRRCALLLEVFFADPSAALAAEIRQIEAKLGATVDDRMRLRLRVHSRPAVAESAEAEPEGRPRLSVAPDPRRAVSA